MQELLDDIRACRICGTLPLGPRPILQASAQSRILIAGQAPGRITHGRGLPFDDASGNRLRDWLGVDRRAFYDPALFAILPMGFCYPGSGPGGDAPPRPECAPAWRSRLLAELREIRLTLLIGRYAQAYHLPDHSSVSVTQCVKGWRDLGGSIVPLPHPSPRNTGWLKANSWFAEELLPALRLRVAQVLAETSHPSPEQRSI